MPHTCRGAGSRAIRCGKERGGECVREKGGRKAQLFFGGWRGKGGNAAKSTLFRRVGVSRADVFGLEVLQLALNGLLGDRRRHQ